MVTKINEFNIMNEKNMSLLSKDIIKKIMSTMNYVHDSNTRKELEKAIKDNILPIISKEINIIE